MNSEIFKRYADEYQIWKSAGKPFRTDEKIIELFAICNECPFYKKINDHRGKCTVCGCGLKSRGKILNKLAWSTTRCPLDEPKWVEEEGYDAEILSKKNAPETNVSEAPRKRGGCGCGG